VPEEAGVTCSECETRRRHVTESTELLRDKMLKSLDAPEHVRPRLLESSRHQFRQALDNLAFHEAECTERTP
jgi:hypothetical protein